MTCFSGQQDCASLCSGWEKQGSGAVSPAAQNQSGSEGQSESVEKNETLHIFKYLTS